MKSMINIIIIGIFKFYVRVFFFFLVDKFDN